MPCALDSTQGYLGSSVNGDAAEPAWIADTKDGSAWSLDFDGTNDFAYHNHAGVDAIDGAFSMSADVNVDAFDQRDNIIVQHNKKFYMDAYASDGATTYRVKFLIHKPGGGDVYLLNNIYLNVGTWYNIECKYTGTEMQVLVDGTPQAGTVAYSGGVKTDSGSVILGSYGSSSCFLDGKIDNVHITPEPATMTLLLLGLPFALRRKRQ